MLTPVPFRKGRQFEPRLSEPYVRGRHSERFWSEAEIDVVRTHYESKGPQYCLALLPGRRLDAVYRRASMLGLRRAAKAAYAPRIGTSLDEAIMERWPSLKGRGAVSALAAELGIPRPRLSARATALGLTLPHRKDPPWIPAEDDLLKRAPVNNPRAASAFFAAHGFNRSPSAIMVRCKRAGVSRRRRDVLSARGAARILGVDSKVVASWITDGLLKAELRGTKRLPQQGGDVWTIRPADLRQFILEQLDHIDIRKVDKHAFVDLLAGPAVP